MAALVAIKQAGTNGGGFFGPNSAHPFENPTPWSNLLAVASIVVLPMASIVMAGIDAQEHEARGGDLRRDAHVAGCRAWWSRSPPRSSRAPRPTGLPVVLGPNMEGTEVRFGPVASATWAAMTTGTSNGSVNSMHDSLNPIAGLVPMCMMMLNVVFSGIGAGFENMLDVHHRRRVPRRLDGRANAGIPRQEGRGEGGEAGDGDRCCSIRS